MDIDIAVGLKWQGPPLDNERTYYELNSTMHFLVLGMGSPTHDEALAFEKGDLHLRYIGNQGLFCLVFRFGLEGRGIPWLMATFQLRDVDDDVLLVPEVMPILTMVLVDTTTHVIRGIRHTQANPAFSRGWCATLRLQEGAKALRAEYEAQSLLAALDAFTPTQLARYIGRRDEVLDDNGVQSGGAVYFAMHSRFFRDPVPGRDAFLAAVWPARGHL